EEGLEALPFDHVRGSVSHGSTRLVELGFPGVTPTQFARLQGRFLKLYAQRLADETRLFEGMDVVLADLARAGRPLGIVTNKPTALTLPLLEALDLRAPFAAVVCGDTLSSRKPHPLPMRHAAALAGVAAEDCVYVGDAERDVQAAHAAGMQALVATYGYIKPDEDWRAWGGEGSIDRPLELLRWLEQRED
ncbi:MAG TPA: HAD-IA family hydrolase, partial [Steroidobacteraceae bacterium]|nr:HAD-IA family hydrolase [Steroidobacteraceae bacterium]